MAARDSPGSCPHCGTEVLAGAREAPYCCRGCREVARLLTDAGLSRYYALSPRKAAPVPPRPAARSLDWLTPLVAKAQESPGACRIELDVQGIHCAACVWLLSEVARRRGSASCAVNAVVGKVSLAWKPGAFDPKGYVEEVERFGYLFGPDRKRAAAASRGLVVRIGIAAALSLNVMTFQAAFYAGLSPAQGVLFSLFTKLAFALSAVVVLVGGSVFFRSAFEGLRQRVLHLDLPIALGILLAFGVSALEAIRGRGDLTYFDSVDAFVTLMLVGRLLQERLVERNRRYLLEDVGVDGLVVRRLEGGRTALVKAAALLPGDEALIAPGEIVPVESTLLDEAGSFSRDWITGESEPAPAREGEAVAAGSVNAAWTGARVRAREAFADSRLRALLRSRRDEVGNRAKLLSAFTRFYVPAVLGAAAVGLAIWWHADRTVAINTAVALLVVTCPCAIGIGVPLAYELAFASLRRDGVFVRTGVLLDRLPRVRQVLFDKTGTLTLGRLELASPRALDALGPEARDAAFDLASHSNHPVSRALAEELGSRGAHLDPEARPVERPGEGLALARNGHLYRLGSASFAAPGTAASGTLLTRDGTVLAELEIRERFRPGAREQVRRLLELGLKVRMFSGDAPAKVAEAAMALGIPPAFAHGGQSPEDKAAAVAALDRGDTLYLGDGVNDALAFERATCTGTPAVDRPVMPGRSDFFLLGDGLGGLSSLFMTARRLQHAVWRNLGLALVYNALAVAACFAGSMTPLRAAIAMPLSSLTVILVTAWGMRRKSTETVEEPLLATEAS